MLANILKKDVYLGLISIVVPLSLLLYFKESSLESLAVLCAILGSLAIYYFDLSKFIWPIAIFSVLLSVDLDVGGGSQLALPIELLAIILAGNGLSALVLDESFRKSVLKSHLTWSLGLFIFFMIISSIQSTMRMVSYKYTFIISIYILVGISFIYNLYKGDLRLHTFFKILSIPLFFLSAFAVYNLLPYNFNPGAAAIMARPFFKDHTVFSATISLLIPIYLGWSFIFSEKAKWVKFSMHLLGFAMLVVIFISSSRAAWISLILSGALFAFIYLGLKTNHLLITVLILGSSLFFVKDKIEEKFLVNPYTSTTVSSSLEEQALSVTNITSDVSNMERINRWKCAWRMFLDKPIFGFGPGTYQFQYFPYQRDEDMTYISVTSPFVQISGRGGSAHSEYLLLLSEGGILVFGAWLLFLIGLLKEAFSLLSSSFDHKERMLIVLSFLGCFTYFIHGAFNNYLNSASFGITFWVLASIVIFYSIKSKEHVSEISK